MPAYRRLRRPGGTYFFTLCLADGGMDHLTEHAALLRVCFQRTMAAKPFRIDAISVLPDHLHMVITLPAGDDDYSNRISAIKGSFSRNLPKGVAEVKRPARRKERGIWQRRFWEHTISGAADLEKHIGYCHWDPVRHGVVKSAEDWALSSIHRNKLRGGIVGKLGPTRPCDRIKFGERSCVDRVV
ncbi:MAG: transposase [Pseudomonadota bacterium]